MKGIYEPIKDSLNGNNYKDQETCPECGYPVEAKDFGYGCVNPDCHHQYEIIKNLTK